MEQFKNLSETTLNGAINNSVTSVTVTDGTQFPATGNFRVKVDTEIMLVTARATHVLTVTRGAEGSTAASHTDLTKIEHVLTAGAIEQALSDLYQTGAYASRPSTVRAPTIYDATDVDQSWIYRGSNWDLHRPVYVPYAKRVDVSGWTSLNHSTETWTDVNGTLHVTNMPTSAGHNVRGYYKSLPSAPYTVNIIYLPPLIPQPFIYVGFGLRESSSGKLKYFFSYGNNGLFIGAQNFTSATVQTSDIFAGKAYETVGPTYLRIIDDNTNWSYQISQNGLDYTTMAIETRNTFCTPDQAFIGINNLQTSYSTINAQWLSYWEG